jgi:hypothetical protein
MKPIELILHAIDGYLISLTRDPINGWYVLEIGLPKTWVFDENNKIGCEVIEEYEQGKIIKISPKKEDVVIDDLIAFVEIIIQTNEKIAEKEKQFTDKMQEMKGVLEKEATKFYQELDELKENSFKNLNISFAKNLDKPKNPRKPRTVVKPMLTNTISEETIEYKE